MLFTFLLTSCSQNKLGTDEDQHKIAFIESLSDSLPSKSINLLDSLITAENSSGLILGKIYFEKGLIYGSLQNDQLAASNFNKALDYFEQQADEKSIANTKLHLGSINVFLGKREEATENLLEALEICQSIGDKKIEANVYNSLAHVYFKANDFQNAIDYSVKAIEIQIAEKDSIGLSSTYNNLAVIYKNTMNLKEAMHYNLLALKLNKNRNDKVGIAKSYNNLGQVSELLDDEKEAFEYYRSSYSINKEIKILNSISLRNLATLYQKNQQLDSAKWYFQEAIKIEEKAQRSSVLKLIYEDLLRISIVENQQEKSIVYQRKIDSLSNQMTISESQQKLKSLENQYQAKTSEKELEQKTKDNNKNRIIFIVILILLISIALFVYQRNKNRSLKLIQEKLILEQRVLRSQMNPHFIFNALSAIQNSLMDNDSIKSASYLSRFAKLIRQNFDFINHRTISLADEIDALTNYMDTQKLRFQNKFDYRFDIDDSIDPNLIQIPPLLLQPFVENSIEHGFKNKYEKGLITIKIDQTAEALFYSIIDNGIGFDQKENQLEDHAIDVFKKRMKLLEEKNEKNFKISSNEEGTTVEFNLKK